MRRRTLNTLAAFGVWLVIALVFFGGWVAFLEIVAKGQHDHSQGNTQPGNGGNVSGPASLQPKPQGDQGGAGKGDSKSDPSLTDWIQAGSAAVIVFLTIGLLFVYGRQTAIMRQQARRMRQTIRTLERTERRQLRAYVGVEKIEIKHPGISKPDIPIEEKRAPGYAHEDFVCLTIKNFGQTPAYAVSTQVNWMPTPYPMRLPDGFDYPDIKSAGDGAAPIQSRSILHKDQTHTAIIAIFDLAVIRATLNKQAMLYLYGHIDFTDIYNRQWIMDFCYLWEPWATSGITYSPYMEHNEERRR